MKDFLKMLLLAYVILYVSIPVSAKGNDTWITEEAQGACVKYGEEYGICPELLMAIIERESSGEQFAENGNCKGLMQISVNWHKDRMERLGVSDIFETNGNIHVGADYLSELFEKHGKVATVLMVYHGEKNAVSKSENGEISDYAIGILERSAELERTHEK